MFSDTCKYIEIQIIRMRPMEEVGGRDCTGVISGLKGVITRPGTCDPLC